MRRPAAFTLIEVLLTLALLALLASVFVTGAGQFFNAREARPEDDFWSTVAAARTVALNRAETVTLTHDAKAGQLVWTWSDGRATQALPASGLRFLTPRREGARLLGGTVVEDGEIARVRFYPDGTCDAFRVEITTADNRKQTLRIDPWTCAPVLGEPAA